MSRSIAEHRLVHQRTGVRRLTADLVRLVADELGGVPGGARGRWRGCESAFPEGFRSFHYAADGRVDVAGAGRAHRDTHPATDLATLRATLVGQGYRVGEPRAGHAGGAGLEVSRGGLTGAVSEPPGRDGPVLVWVAGACVDVPDRDRGAWLTRRDPDPTIP